MPDRRGGSPWGPFSLFKVSLSLGRFSVFGNPAPVGGRLCVPGHQEYFFLFLNWSIVALQHCVSLYCTAK